jgi:hypothetical protein
MTTTSNCPVYSSLLDVNVVTGNFLGDKLNWACTSENRQFDNDMRDAHPITEHNGLTRSLLLPDWLTLKYNSKVIERTKKKSHQEGSAVI